MDAPKKRGRPVKNQTEEVVTQEVAPLQVATDIKHVIRTLNWSGENRDQSQPAPVIEDYLRQSYFSQGYVLYSIETLEIKRDATGPFGNTLLYVLVKYAE